MTEFEVVCLLDKLGILECINGAGEETVSRVERAGYKAFKVEDNGELTRVDDYYGDGHRVLIGRAPRGL